MKNHTMLSSFIEINRRLSRKIARLFPHANTDPWKQYGHLVEQRMNAMDNCIIVDVGGGKNCPFARFRQGSAPARLFGADISLEQLMENKDVDGKIQADAIGGLPFRDKSVDIVTSRMFLEHLPDTASFVSEAGRILKEGGYFINIFPSKFSLYSIIVQMMPHVLSRGLLYLLHPESKGLGGFPAYYDKCYYSAFKGLLEDNGFMIAEEYFAYYQSNYYNFFVPFFIISMLYEAVISAVQSKNLCDTLLIVAKKK